MQQQKQQIEHEIYDKTYIPIECFSYYMSAIKGSN